MQHQTWTMTEFRDGEAVATEAGLSHQDAVEAIQRAMYGETATPVAVSQQSVHDLPLAA